MCTIVPVRQHNEAEAFHHSHPQGFVSDMNSTPETLYHPTIKRQKALAAEYPTGWNLWYSGHV
jgi:hypothetical protein